MALFEILAERFDNGARKTFLYDNLASTLTDTNGKSVIAVDAKTSACCTIPFEATSRDTPKMGKRNIKRLKIQLGLSCNYSCTYCSQRFVPHADETTKDDVIPFLHNLPNWFDGGSDGKGTGTRIEFWGGEPFVYWKTLKPLAEGLRKNYPAAQFYITTNGTLLDAEKNAWLDELGFAVGLSHDGPGYHVRGLDPLEDAQQRAQIADLWQRLGPKGRMSFNAMMHKGNDSRAAVNAHLVEKFGKDVRIGEGAFVEAYDEGGLSQSMPDIDWSRDYAKRSFLELRSGMTRNMGIGQDKIREFVTSIENGRRAETLGQKCGMDNRGNIAVDLKGNVLTCQNVSAAAVAPNGESHHIGHVTELAAVKLDTATHWQHRDECATCPVLQLCKGSCMFLEGERWEASCNSAFHDNVAFLGAGIEMLTGYAPIYIDGPQREDRKDVFGFRTLKTKTRRTIPIVVANNKKVGEVTL